MLIWTRKKGTAHTLVVEEVPDDNIETAEEVDEDEPMELPEADLSATVVKKPTKKA